MKIIGNNFRRLHSRLVGRLATRRGFGLVEVLIITALMSWVILMVGQTLSQAARAKIHVHQAHSATTLATMAFEQFKAYANAPGGLSNLSTYVTTSAPETPQQFFNAPDNLGYDYMTISSTVNFVVGQSTAEVDLSVYWPEGGQQRAISFTRYYSATTSTMGGVFVNAQVISACGNFTTPADIIQNCPPIKGVNFQAMQADGITPATGVTDASGTVQLANVITGPAVPITITAPAGSNFNSATFAQGYYAVDGSGNYMVSISSNLALSADTTGTFTFLDFKPAGQITGNIKNLGTAPNNTAIANMQVSLATGAWVAASTSQTGFMECAPPSVPCHVMSDANGNFSFANVIPSPTVTVLVDGIAGSLPTATPPVMGYTGTEPNPTGTWSSIGPNYVPTAVLSNTPILPMGVLTINVVDQSHNPVSGANLVTIVSTNAFRGALPVSVTTPQGGIVTLNNAISDPNVDVPMIIQATSSDGSLFGETSWTCSPTGPQGCMDNTPNSQTLVLVPNYTLTGTLSDRNPSPPSNSINAMSVTALKGTNVYTTPVLSDSNGNFSIPNFYPLYYTSNPTQPFTVPVTVSKNFTPGVTTNFSGQVVSSYDGQPAPEASLTIGAEVNVTTQTDVTGRFSADNLALQNWTQVINVSVTCTAAGSSCQASSSVGVDTSLWTVQFRAGSSSGWYLNTAFVQVSGAATSNLTLTATLPNVLMTGTVTDAIQGTPLAGVTVNDGNSSATTTTLSDGTYSFQPVVSGRKAGGSPGTVTIVIPAITINSQKYYSATTTISVPPDPDPTHTLPGGSIGISPIQETHV